jgi:predicted transcriptional regulator
LNELKTLLEIGVPPARIAAHLGVSRVAVHYWQVGAHRPSGEHVLKLTELLNSIRVRLCHQPLTVR